MTQTNTNFINTFGFIRDNSKEGRTLEHVKVGKIYVSRLVIQSGQITGNYYHKKTSSLIMVEAGKVQMKYVQVNTKEEKEIILTPSGGLINVPPYVAFSRRNIGTGPAVVIIFSDAPIREGDDFEFEVYKD